MRRALVLGVLVVVGLSGCTSVLPPAPTATATLTVAPTPAPTVTVTPSTPTPTTSTPTAPPSGAKGCSNGATAIPAGASSATIVDVDGDQRDDTAFYSESGPVEYGIRTAAGGVYTIRDGLAGPGVHGGWTAAFDASPGHLTVLDDGRTAGLYAFVGCRFVQTRNREGEPYRFGLNGFSDAGTGVACNDRNGGTLLEGVLARRRSDGRYDVRWTQIDVSADGATATNGSTETRWSGLAADDPRVRAAMGSHCGSAPKVGTSGR